MRLAVCVLAMGMVWGCLPQGGRDEPLVVKPPATMEDDIAVYFSPKGGAMAAIIREIERAQLSVDVQAYVITAKEIVDALEAAHRRGIEVRVILDKNNPGGIYSALAYFSKSPIPVWQDGKHKGLHD